MLLALLPIKSLFQTARRRKTNRLFTTNVFNTVTNLLTSATLVLKICDQTHLRAVAQPKIHLGNGQVRPSSKYIWSIPLIHPSQQRYQNWIKSNVSLVWMPRLYCQLKLLSICIWFMPDDFFVLYERILKIWISCLVPLSKGVTLTSCLSSYLSRQKSGWHAVLTTSSWVFIFQ